MVLVESMACGVPPVAVNRFGPSEIISDGNTGWLVQPDDVDDLAEALLAAIDDPAERARRGARGLAVALQRYSWPALAGRLAGVLDTVASNHRRVRRPDQRLDDKTSRQPM